MLLRAAQLIEERADEIAVVLTREQGKPVPDSRKEILFGAQVLRYYAEEGRRIGGTLRQSSRPDVKSVVSYAPVGVVGAIVPWNYPVDLYCWKVAPALAAGCPVVVKPPVETPLAVGLVVRCLVDAGLPGGVLSDLPGAVEAGQRLVAHPDVRMVTATASTATGQAIMAAAAPASNGSRSNSAARARSSCSPDADIPAAAAAAARRSFSNMGQICIAVNRILVADRVADPFVAALAAQTEQMRLGHGITPGIEYGPVLNQAVRQRAAEHIEDARGRGAGRGHRWRGAARRRFERGTFYLDPTVLDHVPLGARVMKEETFGPVAAVHRVDDDATALTVANNTPYGLAAYLYTADLERAWAMADRLEFGCRRHQCQRRHGVAGTLRRLEAVRLRP